jgi:nucleoside-diphosphate-sugar epimerase
MRHKHVLVTGGAGYVGSALVPKLLDEGYKVTVLDLYIYGTDVFGFHHQHENLYEVRGDIRDPHAIADAMQGVDAVVHLACISNDPSYDLDPALGRSINHDAFRPLVRAAKAAGAKRFVYASSSSVYGVKADPNVTEDLPLEPLTDYSKFKALCENILDEEREPGFVTVTVRPSTVCGYARRLRLDLVVNILTNHAIHRGRIKVLGGDQMRPNIHIDDMVDVYRLLLESDDAKVDGRVFNAGYENYTVRELAEIVQKSVGSHPEVEIVPTDDNRSYHVSSARIRSELGFVPKRTIGDAVTDLKRAFESGFIQNPLENPYYFNIKRMQEIELR